MRRLWPLLLVTATIALAGGANAQLTSQPHASPSSNNCVAAAAYGGGQAGCTWTRSFNLGPMPGDIYWHIDRFSDVPTAEAARTLYGSVTVALGGQVFLQTINDNPGWTAPGGERLALVGPLRVPSGPDLEARLMEVTAPVSARLDSTSGPKAMFVLGGSIWLRRAAGRGVILPVGRPRVVRRRAERDRRERDILLSTVNRHQIVPVQVHIQEAPALLTDEIVSSRTGRIAMPSSRSTSRQPRISGGRVASDTITITASG